MTTTRKRDRAVALTMAALFFVFGASITILAIYQSATANNSTTPETQTNTKQTLAGTKLANFTPVSKVESLESSDTQVGSGTEARTGDTVTVQYTGAVADSGTIFQSTQDTGQPVQLSLSGVIKGWQDGIPGMHVGGKRRLLIPAAEAYGANPPQGSGIPANADLVFDIELVKVGQ